MKTILITGISRGLGKCLFELFVTKGYKVYGVLKNKASAKELETNLPKNANVILADLASDDSIPLIQSSIGKTPVDLLINNAGIAGCSHLLKDCEAKEITSLFNVHCLGALRVTKSICSNLLLAKRPIVINMNSRLGSITRQNNRTYESINVSYSYRIAKAAQNMLTNCLRIEFSDKIKFISLHPGKMKTDIASIDADILPETVAKKLVNAFECGALKEENGIIELEKEVIEW